jgi:adenine-specific DNA-methyltransferase
MDEVFGASNFFAQIAFKAADPLGQSGLARVYDYILWYAKHVEVVKYRSVFRPRDISDDREYRYVDDNSSPSGYRVLTEQEFATRESYAGVFRRRNLTSSGYTESCTFSFDLLGKPYEPAGGKSWATNPPGIERLKSANRLFPLGKDPYFKSYQSDFGWQQFDNCWTDKPAAKAKAYVVQTAEKFIERCMLMTTDPGDLVLDPTCGSGTTAYVAEQWGRRWITCDTSRVPLALARQRLLTATFPYYELKDPSLGPAGGFVYKRKQNKKGEEVGGLVPHITLKSVANDEPPAIEVLVDRPEEMGNITRVSGPFVVEASIAPAQSLEYSARKEASDVGVAKSDASTHIDRMLQVLKQSKTLRLPENKSLVLESIRRLSDHEYLHAEALQPDGKQRAAVVFGPEDGAISSDVVYNAASEALYLKYDQLYFFGFAIQAKARELLEDRKKLRVPCTYVAVTPDVAMSDLLKTSRASEIFSVTGLPDFEVKATAKKTAAGAPIYQVKLLGLDIFDPTTLETESIEGQAVPAWMLDGEYDGMSFHASQVFFPKTSAWDNLQKSLKATFDDSVWAHLSGTTSEPFAVGTSKRVAVKVIDERGNELMRVKELKKDGSWA